MKTVPKLSICIATFNRGDFIVQTLDSIVGQLTDSTELIVVDGASPDGTEAVMQTYCAAHPEVRYVREPVNSGIDRDYDKAVGYAVGEYCWLMTDDDLMVEGAVARVVAVLGDVDLVVVNAEVRNKDLSSVLRPRLLVVSEDKRFDKLTVLSIAPLLARGIREVFDDGSVTSLFDGHS